MSGSDREVAAAIGGSGDDNDSSGGGSQHGSAVAAAAVAASQAAAETASSTNNSSSGSVATAGGATGSGSKRISLRKPAEVDSELGSNLYQQSRKQSALNEKLLSDTDRESNNSSGEGGGGVTDPAAGKTETEATAARASEFRRSSLHDLVRRDFYEREGWLDEMFEILFKIKARGTTIRAEMYFGIIHFVSCFYCIAVVPQQLTDAGYNTKTTAVAVAICSGVGSIFCGLFANLPFVLAPPTVVSIFLSVFCQQNKMSPIVGNYGVIMSGALLMLFYFRPIGDFVRHMIPLPIQVGTAVGIGLLTTLAGSTEIDLVETGEYRILRMGQLTVEIVIAFIGFFLICVSMRYHIIGSFCIAVIFCTLCYWSYKQDFPTALASLPTVQTARFDAGSDLNQLPLLTGDLLFLYIMYMNGLVNSLSSLAALTRDDGAIPRGRWVFVLSGLFTILGGLLTSAPILVSPESSAAIKDGAKTGLSTVVAGMLFLLAVFFSPLFDRIPAAGTSPVLLMIGVILFQNVNRIDWRKVADAAPAFVVLFYIPFTYSIIQGVVLGYILYLAITLMTGELLENFLMLLIHYFPSMESFLHDFKFLRPYLHHEPSAQSDAAKVQIARAALAGRPLRAASNDSSGNNNNNSSGGAVVLDAEGRRVSITDNRPQGYGSVEDDSSSGSNSLTAAAGSTAASPAVNTAATTIAPAGLYSSPLAAAMSPAAAAADNYRRSRGLSAIVPNMLACATIDLDISSIAESIPAMPPPVDQSTTAAAGGYLEYGMAFQRTPSQRMVEQTTGVNPMHQDGSDDGSDSYDNSTAAATIRRPGPL